MSSIANVIFTTLSIKRTIWCVSVIWTQSSWLWMCVNENPMNKWFLWLYSVRKAHEARSRHCWCTAEIFSFSWFRVRRLSMVSYHITRACITMRKNVSDHFLVCHQIISVEFYLSMESSFHFTAYFISIVEWWFCLDYFPSVSISFLFIEPYRLASIMMEFVISKTSIFNHGMCFLSSFSQMLPNTMFIYYIKQTASE